jgi:hypothetical protein
LLIRVQYALWLSDQQNSLPILVLFIGGPCRLYAGTHLSQQHSPHRKVVSWSSLLRLYVLLHNALCCRVHVSKAMPRLAQLGHNSIPFSHQDQHGSRFPCFAPNTWSPQDQHLIGGLRCLEKWTVQVPALTDPFPLMTIYARRVRGW